MPRAREASEEDKIRKWRGIQTIRPLSERYQTTNAQAIVLLLLLLLFFIPQVVKIPGVKNKKN